MSISSKPEAPIEMIKNKLSTSTSIKKIVEKTENLIKITPIVNSVLLFFVIITGIGELFGVNFSIKWHIFFLIIIIIFIFEKFEILDKKWYNKPVRHRSKPRKYETRK